MEVEDTGIGMTPEDQARIFEEFFQVDGAHRAIGEGYGLGLAVARRMAGLMGGDLSVTQRVGQGQHVHADPAVEGPRGCDVTRA